MNTPIPGRTLTQHRKTAVSFRERSLFGIFETSLRSLQYLKMHQHQQAMEQAMSLALACLSFDFVGTCIDDSTEDVGTIQIPSSWRSRVEDPETLEIFFEYYRNSQTPLSNTCLECLVKMASVRRSLFSSEVERISFLGRLIRGTKDVLSSQQGLQHHENYHEFCRLLGRLKTNYQLSELVGLEVYPEWTTLVADFTIESLKSWQWASSSVYYLLGLWSRLVSSVPYLKGDKPSLLETQVPRIVQTYIVSRMAAPEALEEEENLEDQLDSLPYLCRFKYEGTAEFLMQWLDPCIAKFQAGEDINLVESQLTWLVHIVSAVIRGRVSSSGSEPYEHMDGDLIARIFTIMRASEANAMHAQRFSFRSKQLLELALISFMQSLRRAYIGEQVVSSSRVYTRLKEHLGIDDHVAVMDTLLGKICFNLKVYGSCEDIIDATLGLFQDLAAGYMSGKTLLKLDAVSMLLRCHDGRFFKFLECKPGRARTTYYLTLGKLLFMEEKPGAFEAFVDPFDQVLRGIASARTAAVSVQALKGAVHQDMVVGLFRDLRGLVAATTNRRTYGMVFEWLYPQHMPTVITCLETWADVPDVANAILKFFAEFVHNKTQRLTFDSSSANGILLFREVSKALCGYGSRVLEQGTMAPSDPYSQRYKGIWVCLLVLSRALSGNYVNFGVFSLYNDPALVNALDVCLRMVFTISTHDILAYRKVSKSYYAFIDALCHNFVPEIARRDDAILVSIMTTLDSGLKSFDVAISSQCASSIDNLAGYYFKHKADGVKPNETGAQLSAHLAKHPDLLPRLLRTLLETVLFEECSNQWSLSRPLLTLILCTEPIYAGIREQVILTQPADGRHATSAALDRLMENVNRTLDAKNRDRFTQNVTMVRHELKSKAAVTN
jgi:exportin-7